MRVHELKTWPEFFLPIFLGMKTFEIRRNDRDYKVGDILVLNEYHPIRKEYIGGRAVVVVTYCLADAKMGIQDGFIIMGIIPYKNSLHMPIKNLENEKES